MFGEVCPFAPIEHLHQNVIVFVRNNMPDAICLILLRHVACLALSLAALNTGNSGLRRESQ